MKIRTRIVVLLVMTSLMMLCILLNRNSIHKLQVVQVEIHNRVVALEKIQESYTKEYTDYKKTLESMNLEELGRALERETP